ncbi:50S ribosomal protein L9 [Rhodospirillum sp. A1_3_36]|uniref:50S ribosomal protein L9 n=1 Tax=Rhodospirillum sp. A1_3_36 TaxID=3391666 RepID=UPI0039A4F586
MEVILLERIENLGFMGDVVKVKDGYARNFLLPQSKALRKSKANMEYFDSKKVELEAINLKRKEEAQAVAVKMEGLNLVMIRQAGESGQLYGSVTARDITDALKEDGFTVSRQQVLLNQPIKELGRFDTRVSLHPEVVITITCVIARSAAEAEAAAAALLASTEEATVAEAEGGEEQVDGVVHEDEEDLPSYEGDIDQA